MHRRQFIHTSLASGLFLSTGAAFAQETETATDKMGYVVQEMILGNPDAPITLKEYASFTCPHCANFHKDILPTLKSDYIDTGKVKLVYREVYFDRLGLWAAMLARCGGSEKYFGIIDMIYARQRDWATGDDGAQIIENLYKIGRLSGLKDDDMKTCMKDQDMAKALIETYKENVEADEVQSTPSLFIDGKAIGNVPLKELREKLDAKQ